MRAVLIGCAVLASACGNSVERAEPIPVPETTTTAPELTSTVPAPTATEAPTTTEPITEPPTTAPQAPPVSLREQATTTVVRRTSPARNSSSGDCGGSLPPCYVMERESGGDTTVYNYSGSGASGKWQIMPGTWNGYGGYANAADAPESVQDAKARELWNGGRGCWHWDAC